MKRIFIDGKDGTTGLKIYQRFENRNDIELLLIDPEKRKDPKERAKMINESDITFLCLPDAASIEAVETPQRHTEHFLIGLTALRNFLRSLEIRLKQAIELLFRAAMQADLIL